MASFIYSCSMVVVILLLATGGAKAKRDYTIELLELKVLNISDGGFIKSHSLTVADKQVVNIDVEFGQNITEWSMKLSADIITKSNRPMNLLKAELDVCDFLKGSPRNNVVSKIGKELQRSSNIPGSCPLLQNVIYSLRNYTIKVDYLPAILPAAFWQLDFNSIFNQKYTFRFIAKGQVRKF